MKIPASFYDVQTVDTPISAPDLSAEATCSLNGIPAVWRPAEKEAPSVLFFPTPEGNAQHSQSLIEGLVAKGFNVLIVRPSGDTLAAFALQGADICSAAIDFLEKEGCGQLFLFAQGTATLPAVHAMTEIETGLKGIFLEGTVLDYGVWLEKICNIKGITCDGYERAILDAMEEITRATMIFHGALDEITPAPIAERLQADSGARTKHFFIIPGGHAPDKEALCDVGGEPYLDAIRDFINTACGINTWRQRRKRVRRPAGK
jgi:pimeloyl-ACP methyl ester carboxylesterase